jgi:hypothetical protein
MTTRTDVKIIAVEIAGEIQDIGAAAAKALPPGRRYRYSRRILYTRTEPPRKQSPVE